MRMVTVLVVLVACRGEGRAPGPAVRPSGPSAETSTARDAGHAAAPIVTAPAGTDALVAVPAELARTIGLKQIAHGLRRPVLITTAPGDTRGRLFVVEQVGVIQVIEHGKLAGKPFFTIGGLSDGNEQGLLGLAFHPEFAANGKLYVNYTSRDKNTHVVEYRVSATDPDVVDPKTARELFEIDQPFSNHNGGNLLFGPDGRLYTGMGDGGAANDPHANGQNPTALLAKILRIDVDADGAKPEIVHSGMRNPWRFWFDAKTGDLYIGDVGQNLWEEIDVVAGADHTAHNFGWNTMEGTHCFDGEGGIQRDCERGGLTPPIVEYSHEQGCSVTGGVTYRGKALPALDGRYFYADFCTGLLRSFAWTRDPSAPTAPGWARDHWDWKAAIDRDGDLQQISSFGVDADGELYIVELTGSIFELVPRAPA
jgi:glucose/arabinose dehydrogenase